MIMSLSTEHLGRTHDQLAQWAPSGAFFAL
jgi:hypothetical protein